MATKITLKKSSVTGKVPQVGDVEYGEVALNYADGLLFYKDNTNTIDSIGVDWSNIHNNPATDVGTNLYTLPNPDAITFIRVNADNTVSALTDSDFRTAIGTQTSDTGAAITPAGTTEDRDATPEDGYFRYNSATNHFEGFIDGTWINFAENQEIRFSAPDLGSYVIDSFPAEFVRSATYDIQMSGYGGYHTSEVRIIHGCDEAQIVEYGKLLTAENLGYFDANIVNGIVQLSCDFIFSNTEVVLTRTFKTNTGDTYVANDLNYCEGELDMNEGSGTMDLNA